MMREFLGYLGDSSGMLQRFCCDGIQPAFCEDFARILPKFCSSFAQTSVRSRQDSHMITFQFCEDSVSMLLKVVFDEDPNH